MKTKLVELIKRHRSFGRTLRRLDILSKIWFLEESKQFVERTATRMLIVGQKTATKTILIDDERNIEADVVCRCYMTGIEALRTQGPFAKLYIDHDLASFVDDHEFTGYHLMCWLEEFPHYAPREIVCVSANPVGRKKIEQVIQNIYKIRSET